MKRTALYNEHINLNAKMVDFAGWEMPVMYSSIVDEHNATRTKAGLFDVSHMGEFFIHGSGAADFLKKMIPTRLDKLVPGKSMYSVLCKEDGGVIDDLFIYMLYDNEFFVVVNAGTKDGDLEWLFDHKTDSVYIDDLSDAISKIDIQGPETGKIINSVIKDDTLEKLERFFIDTYSYHGKDIRISQTGYTGEFGYEIYIENNLAPKMWNDLLEAGNNIGLKPAGLGARDTLRLESCYSLYGHELDENTTPVEAGLGWLISSDADYIGKNVLVPLKKQGALKELHVFEMIDKGVPREGYQILFNDAPLGHITSGTFSPTLKKGIGMASLTRGVVKVGDEIEVAVRNRRLKAKISKRPLYQYNG